MKPQQLSVAIVILAVLSVVTGVFVKPKYGLDINGGARVVLQADISQLHQGQAWDANSRSQVLKTIERRVNSNGVSEPSITPKGNDQFVVEIPSIKDSTEVVEELQNTAQLQFLYSPDWSSKPTSLARYLLEPEAGDGKQREEYKVTDRTTRQTFRDLYHLNGVLRGFIIDGNKANATTTLTPLPAPLSELPAAASATSLPLTSDDAKALPALATEMANFKSFLASGQLELDGHDLKDDNPAQEGFGGSGGGGAVVTLEFNAAGQDKFATFTKNHTNEILTIYLDGQILMAPNINEPILDGKAQISPFATLADAKQLSDYINSGALPVPLKVIQQQQLSPTLGADAVHQGLIAGLIGILLVVAFMLIYYRLPGSVACLALALYTVFTYAAFLLIHVTFTLPGIAGFILSVGMAVDANILIFERTKEELRAGRTLRNAIEHGFQRAFSAIFDSNVCTAVTSTLLYYYGSGAVKGFALTLLIGVAISMFTAITVTRTLLLLIVANKSSHDLNLWGVNVQWLPKFNVVKHRVKWYALSLLIIVPTLIYAAAGGFKLGIDFTGGSELTLHFAQPVGRAQVESAVAAAGYHDAAAQIAGGDTVFVRLPLDKAGKMMTTQEAAGLTAKLSQTFPGVRQDGFEQIGSSISTELTQNAFMSIFLSSVFIVFYLAFRFGVGGFRNGIKYGVAAVIAMLHDVFVLIGVFCALGYYLDWKIDSLFVTAALTVIGFSVHDTIVIFDRIRENLREKDRHRGEDFDELVNSSIRETFARSVNTSATVVMTLLALLIFGGPVIRPLNAALLIGIISGTYSSIFNAAPIIVDWRRRLGGSDAREKRSTAPVATYTAPKAGTASTPASRADVTPATNGSSPYTNGTTTDNGVSDADKPMPPPGPRPRRRRM